MSELGKEAEADVKKCLDSLSKQQIVFGWRLPDAKSGNKQPAIADFMLCLRGQLWAVECKEVLHDYRLPYGNFRVDQVARMRRLRMAGAMSIVLVHHSALRQWRAFDVEFFREREENSGSWNLQHAELASLVDWIGTVPKLENLWRQYDNDYMFKA